jgi:hypothetical protein
MASYNIEAIKAAQNKQKAKASSDSSKTKVKYWKPGMGSHDFRFLPFSDSNGQPVLVVSFYDKIKEDDKNIVAPLTFGMEDPIKEMFEEIRKKKDGWDFAKNLRPRERFYSVIIDRADEEAGPQVWQMTEGLKQSFYGILTSKHNVDKDLLDPETGCDWELQVTPEMEGGKPKTYNGFACKAFNLLKHDSCKLHADSAMVKKWLSEIPKLEDMFKGYVKTSEELTEVLEDYTARFAGKQSELAEQQTPAAKSTGKKPAASSTPAKGAKAAATATTSPAMTSLSPSKVDDAIDDVFASDM